MKRNKIKKEISKLIKFYKASQPGDYFIRKQISEGKISRELLEDVRVFHGGRGVPPDMPKIDL